MWLAGRRASDRSASAFAGKSGSWLLVGLASALAGCDAIIGDATPAADAAVATQADAAQPLPPADAAAVPRPDAAPPDARPPCTEGNARVEDPASGACYILFRAARDWLAAQAACAELGGHLATATSLSENELMSQIVPGNLDVWIGATDEVTEDAFVWVNGEPFVFDHWRQGEPNNGGDDGENCAVAEGDNNVAGEGCLWDDRPCEDGRPFLCERR
jgi:hypothetical protein